MDRALAVPDGDSTQTFLGKPQLVQIPHPSDPWDDVPVFHGEPDWRNRDALLPLIKHASPIWRRFSIWAWALHNLCKREPTPELLAEHKAFRDELEQYLTSIRLLGPRALAHESSDGHIRWYGPTPRKGEPYVNALGTSQVPVYRLLWLWHMPFSLPGARSRPVRNRAICPLSTEDAEHPCVSPFHFRIYDPARHVPTFFGRQTRDGRAAKNWALSGLHPETVGWHTNPQTKERECNVHNHVLSDYYQVKDNLKPSDSVYCRACHKFRQQDLKDKANQSLTDRARERLSQDPKMQAFLADLDAEARTPSLPEAAKPKIDYNAMLEAPDEDPRPERDYEVTI